MQEIYHVEHIFTGYLPLLFQYFDIYTVCDTLRYMRLMVALLIWVQWLHQISSDWSWLAVTQQDLSKIHGNPTRFDCGSWASSLPSSHEMSDCCSHIFWCISATVMLIPLIKGADIFALNAKMENHLSVTVLNRSTGWMSVEGKMDLFFFLAVCRVWAELLLSEAALHRGGQRCGRSHRKLSAEDMSRCTTQVTLSFCICVFVTQW